MRLTFRQWIMLTLSALALAGSAHHARADQPLRVAKAVAYPFAYTPVDVAEAIGAFKKHGLDVEVSAFTGAPKMQAALASDSVDIGVGSGTDMSFIAKGAPVMDICAANVSPPPLALLVTKNNPIKSVDELKGKTIGTSTPGSIINDAEGAVVHQRLGQGRDQDGGRGRHRRDAASDPYEPARRFRDGSHHPLSHESRRRGAHPRALRRLHQGFHLGGIYARNGLLKQNPEAARQFLAAWFDAVAYMKSHRDETIKIVQPVMHVGPEIAARSYDEMMSGFSDTGRFPPDSLKLMARSFVDLGIFEKEPDMSKLYTEAYLPAAQ